MEVSRMAISKPINVSTPSAWCRCCLAGFSLRETHTLGLYLRSQNTAKQTSMFCFLGSQYNCLVFGVFKLFQNLELMIPDRLQYFWNDLWNFENIDLVWNRRPPNYYKNASKQTRKMWTHPWQYYSSYLII